MTDSTHHDDNAPQAVRFSSITQEISPSANNDVNSSLEMHRTTTAADHQDRLSEEHRKEIRDLSVSLQQSRLNQTNRMNQFVFEPVSLPPSRTPSGASSTQILSASGNLSHTHTPHTPLTPAHSGNKDDHLSSASGKIPTGAMPVTPQVSPPIISQPMLKDTRPSAAAEAREAARPKTPNESGVVPAHPREHPHISLPKGDSLPSSRDDSPLNTPVPGSGTQSPFPRPMTPQGDPNDPYAKDKRAPQSRGSVDNRFVFNKDKPRGSIFTPGTSSSRTSLDTSRPDEKRSSIWNAVPRKESTDSSMKKEKEKDKEHHHHALSDLKRFLKFGGSKKDKSTKESKEAKVKVSRKGTATPPSRSSSVAAMPFADDNGLEAKYGKFERILGAGAGGSVRLMKRQDGVTFAVKQFREKHSWETEKAYNKKITAEFCIGSTLHHGNIIEAMDIIQEKGRWYEVMEYAPFDLFNIVMTGKMSREEVSCCTLQILNGVAFIHSMGLAHRDLKLDNVVVNEYGIMKIIDFGSAHVFQYPFEKTAVMAEGVVGSDPYLAPEVFTQKSYDAQKVDVWSLAIIFCCMSLRRFPWKCPKGTDNSFKLFITQPTEDELATSLYPNKPHGTHSKSEPVSRAQSDQVDKRDNNPESNTQNDADSQETATIKSTAASTTAAHSPNNPTVIKGPWRLLRLLPRETRHIVGRMLDLDPKNRAALDEVTADSWVAKSAFCSQEVGGKVLCAEGHDHILAATDESGEVKVARRPTPSAGVSLPKVVAVEA